MQKHEKLSKLRKKEAKISDTPFDQKFVQPPEEGVLRRHTHTDGHRNSMTESAQRGQVSEKCKQYLYPHNSPLSVSVTAPTGSHCS